MQLRQERPRRRCPHRQGRGRATSQPPPLEARTRRGGVMARLHSDRIMGSVLAHLDGGKTSALSGKRALSGTLPWLLAKTWTSSPSRS
mmetsp:Transcript_61034/g.132245  ORF Transcript_61034/g.132245 Transcript_61034/m.132245 type:complete len:88 (+) Transcript_61034:67-330(+)